MREVTETFAGKFDIIQQIGRGGMGSVFLAQQCGTRRRLAVKVLHGMRNKKDFIRFDREMSLMASVSHPNVVKVFDFGQATNGSTYLAMEYVEGRTLFDLLVQHRLLPLQQSLRIAYYTALGLGAAHEKGIIHRDVKPENIIVSNHFGLQDFAQLLDFGIAREAKSFTDDVIPLTSGGVFLGTPRYAAPEAIRGEVLSVRTDVYSLGCLIFQLLAGRCPFEDPAPLNVMDQHLKNRPTPMMRATKVGIPEELGVLVDAMLSKRPQYRPESMAIVAERLSRYMEPLTGRAVTAQSGKVPAPNSAKDGLADGAGVSEVAVNSAQNHANAAYPAQSPRGGFGGRQSTKRDASPVIIGVLAVMALTGWLLFLLNV